MFTLYKKGFFTNLVKDIIVKLNFKQIKLFVFKPNVLIPTGALIISGILFNFKLDGSWTTKLFQQFQPRDLIKNTAESASEYIKQFSPVQKKYVKPDISPEKYSFEHIIRGDKGDGVPNVLSADDSIVTGTRQKAIRQDKLDIWYKDFDTMPQDAEFKRNYERNKTLVSFDSIPMYIKESIISTYEETPMKDKSKLLDFFVEHKMKNMLEVIEEF
jgi:hypothetical protein